MKRIVKVGAAASPSSSPQDKRTAEKGPPQDKNITSGGQANSMIQSWSTAKKTNDRIWDVSTIRLLFHLLKIKEQKNFYDEPKN